MSWVKSDWRFTECRATFFVTEKKMVLERLVLSVLEKAGDPELLENAVRELLKKYRPELAEASIYYLGYDVNRAVWEIGVTHPSLKRTGMFDVAIRRPLDPVHERDMPATEALADGGG